MDSIPNHGKHPRISLFLYADSSLHMLGADGSVYVCGENASDPSYSTPKSQDIDNALRSTLRNSQADWNQTMVPHRAMRASQIPVQMFQHL